MYGGAEPSTGYGPWTTWTTESCLALVVDFRGALQLPTQKSTTSRRYRLRRPLVLIDGDSYRLTEAKERAAKRAAARSNSKKSRTASR